MEQEYRAAKMWCRAPTVGFPKRIVPAQRDTTVESSQLKSTQGLSTIQMGASSIGDSTFEEGAEEWNAAGADRAAWMPRRDAETGGHDRSHFSSGPGLLEELTRIRKLGYAISADEPPSLIGSMALRLANDLLAAARDLGDIWPIPRPRTPVSGSTA
ncbi:hypothetical protein QN224_32850 [Sinorhizobium sp. 8-89]|uniref:hypothetical protein n=1 Tax=Sinorhizobium sp. 7-81 TaxID=3049087 RepID=UPI0024C44C5B|nr:hypothetical protein [Sinorhizobium sp. 7-81]MDK1390096.1 hypothetical protein [Sinorhizobium sp. 7-81]